jgi:uncharacterized protein involved in exopolysaccharide biosynthesis
MSPSNGQPGGAITVATRHALSAHAAANLLAAERLNDAFNLRDLMRIFLKRKWTIFIIFTVFAVFSVVRTYMAQPVYRASTTIQIERFASQVLNYKDVTPVETDYSDSGDFYTTNYELLRSRSLSERAVEDLGLRKAPSPDAGHEPVSKPVPTSMIEDIITRIRRGPPAADVDAATKDDNALVGAFQSSITVEPVRRSRLVRLYFDSTDPFFAAKAVNTLAQSFININLERRFEASAYAKTFLEEKLGQTKAKLEDSEADLVKFSREGEVFNLDDKQNISNTTVQGTRRGVEGRAGAHQGRRLYRQAVENPTRSRSRAITATSTTSRNRQASSRRSTRTTCASTSRDSEDAGPEEPDRRGRSPAAGRIRPRSPGHVIRVPPARAQEQMLRERLSAGKQQMLDLQGRSVRYGILKREVDTNRELYNGLLQRLKEVGVAGGVGTNNISVVDKAQVPLYPYKPDFSRSVTMGLAIGLIIGLLVAWLLEHLDDSIRFADEVEKETGAAVLGVVPKLKALEPGNRLALSPHLDPASAFSEAYRSVRTALQFPTASALRAGLWLRAARSTRARARRRSRSRSTSLRWANRCSSWTRTCATPCCTS